ncbi:MAG: DEAD/DEAH box helicase, partial [Caulobacteraceae bacterium]|nr:DEAD/DEAH box helicase [Caulobacteraceae bacterium]
MKLRPYQQRVVDSVIAELENSKSTLVVLPTGGGKTVCFAHLVGHFMKQGRVMVIAHREELIRQAASKIEQIVGYRPAIEMADEWADEEGFNRPKVVVASVQTLVTGRVNRFNPEDFALVITDEAHHCIAQSYRKVYDHILRGKTKHLGVTATPDRADEQALGQVFQTVAFDYELPQIIDDGWLVPIRQKLVMVEGLDYSKVKTTAGDLNQGDVAKAQANEQILHEMIAPIIDIAGTKKTIVFATPGSKKTEDGEDDFHIAQRMTEILNRHRPNAARRVSQDTPKVERRQMLQDFAAGRFQFLVNVGVL